MVFGIAVRRRRESLRLSVKDLADLTGCSRSYVYQIENGEKFPSVQFAEGLEKVLEMRLVETLRAGGQTIKVVIKNPT